MMDLGIAKVRKVTRHHNAAYRIEFKCGCERDIDAKGDWLRFSGFTGINVRMKGDSWRDHLDLGPDHVMHRKMVNANRRLRRAAGDFLSAGKRYFAASRGLDALGEVSSPMEADEERLLEEAMGAVLALVAMRQVNNADIEDEDED